VRQGKRPLLAARYLWATRTDIDRGLVAGSILFGAGWGLVGFCPGPALVNLAGLMPSAIVFVVAMAAGMILKDLWDRGVLLGTPVRDDTLSPSADGSLDTIYHQSDLVYCYCLFELQPGYPIFSCPH
jgi:hypothetical protein